MQIKKKKRKKEREKKKKCKWNEKNGMKKIFENLKIKEDSLQNFTEKYRIMKKAYMTFFHIRNHPLFFIFIFFSFIEFIPFLARYKQNQKREMLSLLRRFAGNVAKPAASAKGDPLISIIANFSAV